MTLSKTNTVVIHGSKSTGKTALWNKLTNPNAALRQNYVPTIGIDLGLRNYKNWEFQIWDTPAAKPSNLRISNPGDKLHILCIDLSQDLKHQEDYIKQVTSSLNYSRPDGSQDQLILVWTKSDEKRVISDKEMQSMSSNEAYHLTKSLAVSVKNNEGMDELLDHMVSLFEAIKKQEAEQEYNKASDIEKALLLLNDKNSELYKKINALKIEITRLPQKRQTRIGTSTLKLIQELQATNDIAKRIEAIDRFEKDTTKQLGGYYLKAGVALVAIAITALVTVIAAAIGFGIGFAAGAWTGPGAFISGVVAGSAVACAVVAVSASLGVGLGLFGGHLSHKGAKKQNAFVHEIADTARLQSSAPRI